MNDLNLSIMSATLISMKVATLSTIIAFPAAVFFGWILARKSFPGKVLLSTTLMAPVVCPPVVVGFFLLETFHKHHALGKLLSSIGITIPFTVQGAVVASIIVGFPFFVMGCRSAFEKIDMKITDTARTLGLSELQIFMKITFPLALPGIAAGAVIAFARSLGEFGATVVVAGNLEGQTRTLSLAIYSLLETPYGDSTIYKLIAVSLAFGFVSLIVFECFNRYQLKRLES